MDSPLCSEGCGFYGSAETNNMCSKCYANFVKKNPIADAFKKLNIAGNDVSSVETASGATAASGIGEEGVAVKKNRCEGKGCKKKVGLVQFKCKCGKSFCGSHRFPEQHSCSFDFKTFDRKTLAAQNPVIRGDKLEFRL